MPPKIPKQIRNTLNTALGLDKLRMPPLAYIKKRDGSMKPKEAAATPPEMFKKSTKFGMYIEAKVTMIMTSTLSKYILKLCFSTESLGSLKNERSSII
jgi:hypothetical protein